MNHDKTALFDLLWKAVSLKGCSNVLISSLVSRNDRLSLWHVSKRTRFFAASRSDSATCQLFPPRSIPWKFIYSAKRCSKRPRSACINFEAVKIKDLRWHRNDLLSVRAATHPSPINSDDEASYSREYRVVRIGRFVSCHLPGVWTRAVERFPPNPYHRQFHVHAWPPHAEKRIYAESGKQGRRARVAAMRWAEETAVKK